jgi:hypothetical protein
MYCISNKSCVKTDKCEAAKESNGTGRATMTGINNDVLKNTLYAPGPSSALDGGPSSALDGGTGLYGAGLYGAGLYGAGLYGT